MTKIMRHVNQRICAGSYRVRERDLDVLSRITSGRRIHERLRQRLSAFLASLNTIERMLARDRHPRVYAVRSSTLEDVDPIGFVVRRCAQCSAGRS